MSLMGCFLPTDTVGFPLERGRTVESLRADPSVSNIGLATFPNYRGRQRKHHRPLGQTLVEGGESGRTRTARQVQRIGEIEALVECVDRHQDRVAIFECDVLDARQRPQNTGRVPLRDS